MLQGMASKRYEELFSSAARTATPTVAQVSVPNHTGVRVFIDVTAVTATPSVVPTLYSIDPQTNVKKTLLQGAALTATGDTVLEVFPGATAVANTVANDAVGLVLELDMVHADTDSITYQVTAEFF